MKERFTRKEKDGEASHRESPWRFLFAACAVLGAVELLGTLAAWLVAVLTVSSFHPAKEAVSIGIIGGADGPTAIFVATSPRTGLVIPAVMLTVGLLGYVYLKKCR